MPEEQLLAAVLLRAWKDATSRGYASWRYDAIDFINGPGAEGVCDWLGLDVGALRRRLPGG